MRRISGLKNIAVNAVSIALLATCSTGVNAQGIPVIDIASLVQLIQQVTYWQNQLTQMEAHLQQLRQTTSALTGTRGMQALLPVTMAARNYLPTDWPAVTSLTSGPSGPYSGLSAMVASNVQGVSLLPASTVAALPPAQRQLVIDQRNSAAVLQALSQTAYGSASARFQELQGLIQAIGSATDEKAINDLQSRIQAEQTMLSNDHTKLDALYQAAQADRLAQEQRIREMSITQLGSARTLPVVSY